jgi:hypothetical protein
MLALHDLLNTPLYENSGIIIHPRQFDILTLSMQTNTNVSCDINDDESCDHDNEDKFEEEKEDILIDSIVQNILSSKQIYDYFENVVTMAPSQDVKPLGLFQDPHCEELNFLTLFFEQPRSNQGIKMSHQMIVQWELLHKNHNFATHIPNLFSKIIKVLIHSVISSSWVRIHKGKLLGHQIQALDVINKPNLDVILHYDLEYMNLSGLHTLLDYLS